MGVLDSTLERKQTPTSSSERSSAPARPRLLANAFAHLGTGLAAGMAKRALATLRRNSCDLGCDKILLGNRIL